jgi:hypothetical protein
MVSDTRLARTYPTFPSARLMMSDQRVLDVPPEESPVSWRRPLPELLPHEHRLSQLL